MHTLEEAVSYVVATGGQVITCECGIYPGPVRADFLSAYVCGLHGSTRMQLHPSVPTQLHVLISCEIGTCVSCTEFFDQRDLQRNVEVANAASWMVRYQEVAQVAAT